jgi:hypothetical protein
VLRTIELPPGSIVGQATGLVYWDSENALFSSDYHGRITRIDLASGLGRTICGMGRGPGEVREPGALRVIDEALWIADSGNQRVEVVDSECTWIETREASFRNYAAALSIGANGEIADPTGGFTGNLVDLWDRDGRLVGSLGDAVDLPASFSPSDVRAEMAAGRIPPLYLNNVLVEVLDDGHLVVASLGDGAVSRVSTEGETIWRAYPPLAAIRDSVLRAATEANRREDNPYLMHPVLLFADIVAAHDSVWLLSSPSLEIGWLWQLDPASGDLLASYELTGVSRPQQISFIDADRLVVLDRDGERIVEVEFAKVEY